MLFNRSVLSWCLYDLANTIFAMNMTSYHFPVWLIAERGCPELYYSLAFGGSMLLSALIMPALGRGSDKSGRRVPLMVFWTLNCVALTAALSFIVPIPLVLVVFAMANFCFQLAGVFYNALLPTVAPAEQMGRVSGWGVSLGYVGTLIGILATGPIVVNLGRQATFVPTALLFLLLAMPSFFWVQEDARGWRKEPDDDLKGRLRPLLPSAFLGLSAVGTAILFMSVYAKKAVGLSDAQLHSFLTVSTLVTIAGSVAWGRVTDRLGGYHSLWWVWVFWAAAFGLAAVSFHAGLFLLVGCLSGIALAGTWVTSRVLLVELVGPARIGETFGLFGLVSRIAAVAGPVAWALLIWAGTSLGLSRYRVGMVMLLGFTLAGWHLYHRLPASIKFGSARMVTA
ncbi:MAG: MFS transporter [Candidatus Omnitrophica bacterium]|nr:MFS transporter [Candidatus Omnitrophota bacterium]